MATAKAKHAVFEQWFKARCVQDGNASTLQRALYADYAHFARAGAMGDQAFARAMERAGFRVLKLPEGAHRRGIRLKVAFMPMSVADLATDPAFDVTVEPPPYVREALRAADARMSRYAHRHGGDVLISTPSGGDSEFLGRALVPAGASFEYTPPRFCPDDEMVLVPPLVTMQTLAPYVGGPAKSTIVLDCPDDGDSVSALIAGELYVEARRVRQPIDAGGEDLTVADDDALPAGELARMGAAYAFAASIPAKWASWLTLTGKPPRDHEGAPVIGILRMLWLRGAELWKPATQRRMLVKAGALIVHAIARIDREEARKQGGKS